MLDIKNSEVFENFENLEIKRVLLKYEGHLNVKKYTEWLLEKINHIYKIVFISILHEMDNSEIQYIHTSILIEFNIIMIINDGSYFNFNGISPNIKVIISLNKFNKYKNYMISKNQNIVNKNQNIIKNSNIGPSEIEYILKLKHEISNLFIECLLMVSEEEVWEIRISPNFKLDLGNLIFCYGKLLHFSTHKTNLDVIQIPQFVVDDFWWQVLQSCSFIFIIAFAPVKNI